MNDILRLIKGGQSKTKRVPKYALDQRYKEIKNRKIEGDEEFYQAMVACGLVADYPLLQKGHEPTESDFVEISNNDHTVARRQRNRNAQLNDFAKARGFNGLSGMLTALLNGEADVVKK